MIFDIVELLMASQIMVIRLICVSIYYIEFTVAAVGLITKGGHICKVEFGFIIIGLINHTGSRFIGIYFIIKAVGGFKHFQPLGFSGCFLFLFFGGDICFFYLVDAFCKADEICCINKERDGIEELRPPYLIDLSSAS